MESTTPASKEFLSKVKVGDVLKVYRPVVGSYCELEVTDVTNKCIRGRMLGFENSFSKRTGLIWGGRTPEVAARIV